MSRNEDSHIVRRNTRKSTVRRPAFLVDVESAGMVRAVHGDESRRANVDALAAGGDEAAVKARDWLDEERDES